MASTNTIRGSRVGASPARPTERAQPAPRRQTTYWCANAHEVDISLAADVTTPETWECPRCGLPAGQDRHNPPARPRNEPYKSHLAYVKERRSEADGEAILAEALAAVRARRGEV
ncbi:RNA polymerase-binding protein RbpA [Micromonospora sp. NBC_01813]|uniref:RNA polymerase-binding protein RbpA n=1 Tax=Micromonospora sp. NBC_01813 TaxID=2975988 RepID=UPI002DD8E7E3|nr:RNA polymerase-binding protein RbpA [Micromonospora sp. NBC_01813]WSA09863.1 RNA polymerase-binding protein RbpA [Micromonospora sp. NBC_01813]